jgi:uncharacterized protein DUF4190
MERDTEGRASMSYQDPSYDPYQQQPDPYQQHPDPYQQQPQQYQYPAQQPYSAQPYSPYPQPTYPGYAPGPMASSGQTNTMAILSLVFAFVFWPLAIVFGHMAKKQIKERNEQGDGLATAGLVLGYIFGGIALLFCAFYIIVFVVIASHGTSTGY